MTVILVKAERCMIEVLFSESAAGSLKLAQSFGKGEMNVSSIGVIGHKEETAESNVRDFLEEAEEKMRLSWEQAVPMGGSVSDIFGLELAQSVGNIREEGVGSGRLETLRKLFAVRGESGYETAEALFERASGDLEKIKKRLETGENVRIWYSDQPDEMCGFLWFMDQLVRWKIGSCEVYAVRLPDWEKEWGEGEVSDFVETSPLFPYRGWSGVLPSKWHRHLGLQRQVPPSVAAAAASRWKELQEENAPLRAVINGRLYSVSEEFYDPFILEAGRLTQRESPGEIHLKEEQLTARILEKYRPGVSDGWIVLRIRELLGKRGF